MDAALVKKLLLKPGTTLALVSAPKDQVALLGPATAKKGAGLVLLYATTQEEVRARLPKARKLLAAEGRLWVAYPKAKKLGTDLHRDVLWDLMEPEGLEGVRLIALDETWSAMAFRPAASAGK